MFNRLLKADDLKPCPFCKQKMGVINIRDKRMKSELPPYIIENENEIDLIVRCNSNDCKFDEFFGPINLITYKEMNEFKEFWNKHD